MSFENCLRCVPTSPAATQNSDLPRTPPGVSSCRSLPDPHPGGPAPPPASVTRRDTGELVRASPVREPGVLGRVTKSAVALCKTCRSSRLVVQEPKSICLSL